MPYINVDEAYILDNTGLQVDQVVDIPYTDAALTDGQKEQARKNIGAGGTNPNLFTNPWWGQGEIINQRGITSGTTTSNMPAMDRWIFSYGTTAGTYSIGNDGVTITGNTGGFYVVQRLESSLRTFLNGKTVTASAMFSDGNIVSATTTYTGSTSWIYDQDGFKFSFSNLGFQFRADNGNTFTIRAVKLELGSVSTLANDSPPNYANELAKCQYYCRVISATSFSPISVGIAVAATEARFVFPYAMRTTPTVTYSGTVQVNTSNVSAVVMQGSSSDAVGLRFTTTGLTAPSPVILYLDTGAKLTISADL